MRILLHRSNDNTLMDFRVLLNLVLILVLLCLVDSKIIIELNMITRIGMTLLNPKITRIIEFDLAIKYR